MLRLRQILFIVVMVIALAGVPAGSFARTAAVGNDALQQQPDPKKKDLTATLARSAENETLTLSAYFPEDAQTVRVALYNILGKLIEVNPVTSASKGDQTFRFQTRGLPSGPYIVVLEAIGQRVVNKVMVSR